ncbi:NDP-sugar synthase [Flavihumibacter stibioxidans]|uniref:Nucleotidyl transferase domain-containing protein n=1 Tax=Flavihumibacter stibioxidans TaxID=1834163 RepID=A0ABR7M7P3_9BACT|nr:sugar phosphate nucleotidyltransferase [Flavihumibacter stibioxidans]MBC6491040.1 hypothetical protein [Flavihumibacter stibioxidans]
MKAIIFAAGLGTRFKPWTDQHPKALAMVNGKSLLQRNIEYLQRFGINEVVVNVHHFADQVIAAVQENHGWGSRVLISDEREEVLETGGGLLKARLLLEGGAYGKAPEPFVSINADVLTDLDLNRLVAFHEQQEALVSFGVTGRRTSRYLLFDEDSRLRGWVNTKTGDYRFPGQAGMLRRDAPCMADDINAIANGPRTADPAKPDLSLPFAGYTPKAYSTVVVYDPSVFRYIRQTGKFSLIDTYLDLATEHRIMGFDHSGDKFVDVGKPESVAEAERMFG